MAQVLENNHGDILTLPDNIRITGFNRPVSIPMVETRRGQIVTGHSVRRAVSATLTGTHVAQTYAGAQEWLDDLLGFLSAAPIKVRLHGSTSRYLEMYPRAFDDAGTRVARAVTVNIPLVAPDPLWHGDTQTESKTVGTGGLTFTIEVGGNAETHPVIAITGTGTSTAPAGIRIENTATGRSARLSGRLTSGQVLTLHSKERRARIALDGVLGRMNHDYLVHGFPLAPGNNEITVSRDSGSGSITVQIGFVERWH